MPAKRLPIRSVSPGDSAESIPSPKALALVNGQKTAEKKKPGYKQLSIWISDEMMYRISEIARFRKTRKSSFVVQLLDQGCKKYGFDEDVIAVYRRICSQVRDSEAESAA